MSQSCNDNAVYKIQIQVVSFGIRKYVICFFSQDCLSVSKGELISLDFQNYNLILSNLCKTTKPSPPPCINMVFLQSYLQA